jgi:hypothetical protein
VGTETRTLTPFSGPFFGTTLSLCEPTRYLVLLAPLVAGRIRVHVVVNASG